MTLANNTSLEPVLPVLSCFGASFWRAAVAQIISSGDHVVLDHSISSCDSKFQHFLTQMEHKRSNFPEFFRLQKTILKNHAKKCCTPGPCKLANVRQMERRPFYCHTLCTIYPICTHLRLKSFSFSFLLLLFRDTSFRKDLNFGF